MATVHIDTSHQEWHPGELAIHRLLRVPTRDRNPTTHGLPPHYAARVQLSPLLAVGALDPATGRPWTTVWGGEAGFAGRIAPGVLGMRSLVARGGCDPVAGALFGGLGDGEVVRPPPAPQTQGGEEEDPLRNAPAMSALSIDFDTRDRVKLAGRLLAGAMAAVPAAADDADAASASAPGEEGKEEASRGGGGVGEVQLAMAIRESLGNCPKYINRKAIRPHVPSPKLVSDSLPLPPDAVALLARADVLFLSSSDGRGAMDTNVRGGPPGLVRVVSNSASSSSSGVVLAYPEFSGNRLYQTLGNLHADPKVGVVVPDFEKGDVLYVTGVARLLVGGEAARLLPRSNLVVRIEVVEARFVRDGLPFRGEFVDLSPYTPPLRRLACEMVQQQDGGKNGTAASGVATATLTKREVLAPSVARFTFSLKRNEVMDSRSSSGTGTGGSGTGTGQEKERPAALWVPGQHVTLDFGPELNAGWSHMRDDDPQSLNDDFVRTFTVSSEGGGGGREAVGEAEMKTEAREKKGEQMQITVRKHGPATGLLFRWNTRVPLELPVLGFGGEERFRIPVPPPTAVGGDGGGESTKTTPPVPVFVAGGVGITPLLAQAGRVLRSPGGKLVVMWSLPAEDLPFALDSVTRIPGLGPITTLFVTSGGSAGRVQQQRQGGSSKEAEEKKKLVQQLQDEGIKVYQRRMGRDDVLSVPAAGASEGVEGGSAGKRKYYLCMGPEMSKAVTGWLEGEDFVTESFEY